MIGDRAFREAVRTVTVTYPIPFLVVSLMAGGVAMLGLYAAVQVWPLALTGILSVVSAIALAAFSVVRRPELLRSERHTLQQRLIDIISDGDLNPDVRTAVGAALTSTLQPLKGKQPGDQLNRTIESEKERNDE